MFKKISLLFISLCLVAAVANAQTDDSHIRYFNASNTSKLTLIGKLAPTPNLYHRVDTERYPTLSDTEKKLLRNPTGMALTFRTNSTEIWLKTQFVSRSSTNFISNAGYDLYIRSGGEWLYAYSAAGSSNGVPQKFIGNMDTSEKECLLYLPIFSELSSVEVGVNESATMTALANPFRHKIAMFGSSFTHGSATSRAGMPLPVQIERNTGLYVVSLGVSGSSTLQPVFADILAESDADAFLFDAFSNPGSATVESRLFPFIERIQQSHPTKPLIFLATIYREVGNFDLTVRNREADKRSTAARKMQEAMEKYQHVYFVDVPDQTGTDHETSADGVHPSDLGYFRWAQSVQPEILRILATYGIQ
jgi:lysophospholipase L1-like esterase